jgi:hypothetical protein
MADQVPNDNLDETTDDPTMDDFDPLPTDNDDIEEDSTAPEATSLIDLVADQRATEVKNHIFQSLYNKVGERIDAMKAETRRAAFDSTDTE